MSGSDASLVENGAIRIRVSVLKTMSLVLGSAVFAVASGALCLGFFYALGDLITPSYESSLLWSILTLVVTIPMFVLGLVGLVFFGYGTIFLLTRLFLFWRPVVEITRQGITDRSNIVSPGFVPWDEVGTASPTGNGFIVVKVKNEQELIKRQNPVKGFVMSINSRYFTSSPINIPVGSLPVSEEELLFGIKPYLHPSAQESLEQRLAKARSTNSKDETSQSGEALPKRPSARTEPRFLLRWLWAFVLAVFFVAMGLALAGGGLIFLVAGSRLALRPSDLGDVLGGGLGALLGMVAAAGGVTVIFWLMPLAVRKLSGRELAGPLMTWIAVIALSIFYYVASFSLIGFGGAFAWNGIGPGSYADFEHPVAGVVMLATGLAVFVFFPRLVKRLTGHEVLSSPYGGFGGSGSG